MEFCSECDCKCKPIDKACVTKFSDIKDPAILDASHYEKATNDLDSLIGEDCADDLCSALKKAAEDAGKNGNILDFLDDIWKNIVQNKFFKMWYANRLLWHWLNGASISEISASGLVTTRNNDDDYKNDYEHAPDKELYRMMNSAKFYADQARGKFKNRFWLKYQSLYPCAELECGCSKHKKCKDHCGDKGSGGIRAIVV